MNLGLDDGSAKALASRDGILWHQRFQLSDSVFAPGTNDIEWLLGLLELPDSLAGLSVLDIGTTNGGAAFLAEARGAKRVVAVDIYPPNRFGFDAIAGSLGSSVEFVQGSVYALPERLREAFDVVIFYGVLYHLRHPLLAVDALRRLTRGVLGVETAICPSVRGHSHCEFYAAEYAGDASNWFVPSIECAADWFASSGFAVDRAESWPYPEPTRGFLRCASVEPVQYRQTSYEVPLRVVPDADLGG